MIVTLQMIRDKLFFKGPMGWEELRSNFPTDSETLNSIVQKGIESEAIIYDGELEMFYTRWTDEDRS